MRIIAGQWRGRTIKAPKDSRVRPTGDRAREAWMSIVQPEIAGARVIDLYAGSGALGLEALSRGAESADFVDVGAGEHQDDPGKRSHTRRAGPHAYSPGRGAAFAQKLPAGAFDLAFADPPYNLGMAPRLAAQWLRVPFANILGVEHDAHEAVPEGGDTRTYGGTAVTIYRV